MLLQQRSSRNGQAGGEGAERTFLPRNQDGFQPKFVLGKEKKKILALDTGLVSERAADGVRTGIFVKTFLLPFLQQAKNIYVNISYLGFNLWH